MHYLVISHCELLYIEVLERVSVQIATALIYIFSVAVNTRDIGKPHLLHLAHLLYVSCAKKTTTYEAHFLYFLKYKPIIRLCDTALRINFKHLNLQITIIRFHFKISYPPVAKDTTKYPLVLIKHD